jgi:SH3-like domain-containing protein
MRMIGTGLALMAAGLMAAGAPAQEKRKTPYFASISAGKAMMRTGPGRTYPAVWLYVRPDLPVKVVETYKEWRKVEDPGGTTGWMLGALLSETRTGFIREGVTELRERPAPGARVVWRAEKGVIGRVNQCGGGWCRLDVHGQAGFVEAARLWGVEAAETLP